MIPPNIVEGRKGEWMQLASGGKFFPEDPRPEEVNIEDIANALSLTCRYGGQGDIYKFYSVAEHSLLMAEYALKSGEIFPLMSERQRSEFALIVLLHDASEAYAGDLIRSIKSAVGDLYRPLERSIQQAILSRYDLVTAAELCRPGVKELDSRITVNEKAVLFKTNQTWSSDYLKPLPDTFIQLYDPPTAYYEFLEFFHMLMDDLWGVDCSG